MAERKSEMTKRVGRAFDIRRDENGNQVMEVSASGIALLRLPMVNRGTAFTEEERIALRIDGLLPPAVATLEQQVARVYLGFSAAPTPIAKYQYLRALQDRHEILFYALLNTHLAEMLPIIYTPTVGEAVQKYHFLYQSPRGVTFASTNIDRAKAVLNCYPWEDVRMIVATDSSAILGIGDQGQGGMGIAIGKLSLYTAAGGVSPLHTMPVTLDVGTERTDLIHHPHYLGVRERRLKGEPYIAFLDKFVEGVKATFPYAVVQWEDLSKDTAFTVLERYRDALPSFNDDIQGTGAVTLAGVINACRIRGERLRDQRIVIHGAGAGGIGVTWALWQGLIREGLTPEAAAAQVFVLDSKGLLMKNRAMEAYKQPFAQDVAAIDSWTKDQAIPNLVETIANSGATVLIGLSGQPGAFDEAAVRAIAKNAPRPVIFPLSNPTSSCEALPSDILAWTNGKAIVATGSPFAPVRVGAKDIEIGQGNNAFIFPGLGFGAILSNARKITDAMVLEAAYALSDYTAEHHGDGARTYPPVEELQDVSIHVATRVIGCAMREGVANAPKLVGRDIASYVQSRFWKPKYLPLKVV
jgi:malate dehydrogenase (oxaloacetate-decarboxylating)